MKKTEHKTNMLEVCQFLLDGPKYAVDIGDHFWPDKAHLGPSRGGPSSTAVAAAFMLSRIHHQHGYVQRVHDSRPSRWELTNKGHAYLRSQL